MASSTEMVLMPLIPPHVGHNNPAAPKPPEREGNVALEFGFIMFVFALGLVYILIRMIDSHNN